MQNQTQILSQVKKLIIKILNLKLMILLDYQNIKSVFAKGYFPDCSEDVFVIKIVKSTVPLTHVINDLNGKEIAATFNDKES